VEPEAAKETSARYPAVADLWKIDYLGGWQRVAANLFGSTGAYTRSFEELHQRP
jgi:ABC-type sulfate transport system substrate-binding protein